MTQVNCTIEETSCFIDLLITKRTLPHSLTEQIS